MKQNNKILCFFVKETAGPVYCTLIHQIANQELGIQCEVFSWQSERAHISFVGIKRHFCSGLKQ